MEVPAVIAIRVLHALYVGLLLTAPLWFLGGATLRIRSLTSPGLRAVHLAMVGFSATQFTLGWSCPLTDLENRFAGHGEAASFIEALPEGFDVVGPVHLVALAVYGAASVCGHVLAHHARYRGRMTSRAS